MRPVIGINADFTRTPHPRAQLRATYLDAIEAAGGIPVVLAPPRDPAAAGALLRRVDGLVLSGGLDIHPRRYGARARPEVEPLDPRREAFDIALCRAALRTRLPVLGICGGHQVLNVACGGTLLQHIPADVPGAVAHARRSDASGDVRHGVVLAAGSRLARILGTRRCAIVSHHHQAIARLGRGLRVVARAPDDVIEAVEGAGARWLVGVQWHPERGGRRDARLFRALVRAAAVRAR